MNKNIFNKLFKGNDNFVHQMFVYILTCNTFDYVHDLFYLKFKLYFVTNISHFKSEILYKLKFEDCKLIPVIFVI